ncbi:MBL fold metallo-hydrolase [Naasia aerilata]|uniref:MBL fold metallo-hydrolase n=1 Tax=Naasia aerilata TaxID=1162966 RepID=A0ABN6XMN6_9MICO|nr:MBL fold metallo-hydrolase [Naasia aerilata]BDZ46249.1 MBL fold metallo-hydrolase [Naasia aerilata]
MKVTKLEHAALLLEQSGHTLIVDPGSLTTPVTEPGNAVAIVITHEHPDHWTPEQLNRILNKAPGTGIYGPAGVARAAEGFDVTVVAEGNRVEVGPFTLTFYGTTHAVIHETVPAPDNVGILVNGGFFYPGDALTVPDVHVETLALPSAAPWLKLGEAIDYLTEVKPDRVFPVHDMVLSAAGKVVYNTRLQAAAEAVGAQFFALDPGQSIDV